ncbi:hypothetical protein DPX16_12663 [Anabarilius grahami]|uniref:Uncharacterized protein n=1 Tax=Anabarilius grahami TaxID=495550 RepID=A0A3N0YLK1_ANAGA|nr:hypothetical protein DPX16_12663 [Anabarilius grahami]
MDSSTTAPADSGKLPNSSSKSRFQFLHRFFGKIRSFCLPSKYLSSKQKNSNTKTEASPSAAVDRSSEEHREADLLAATQETEPITFVEKIKLSPSFDGSFTSIDTSSDEETQETKPFADVLLLILIEIMDSLGSEPHGDTQTSAPLWVSDLLRQKAATEQDSETQGDDADQAPLGILGWRMILGAEDTLRHSQKTGEHGGSRRHTGDSAADWDGDECQLCVISTLAENEEDHDDRPPEPHNLEARAGEDVRDNLAAAVSAPNIRVPALHEHDYL